MNLKKLKEFRFKVEKQLAEARAIIIPNAFIGEVIDDYIDTLELKLLEIAAKIEELEGEEL